MLGPILTLCLLPLLLLGIEPSSGGDARSGPRGCEGPAALPPRPHEPAGFVCVTNRAFNERQEQGWSTRPGDAFSIVEDRTAPVSPPLVGRARFPVGFEGGRGPINTSAQLRGRKIQDLYLSFWIKFSNSFEGARSAGINKVLHIWLDERSVVVLSAQGRGRDALVPQMRLQNVRADQRGVSFNLSPRGGIRPRMDRDRWHQLEVRLRVNSAGRQDGLVEWWLDGQAAGRYDNVGFIRAGDESYWSEISWNPTWGAPKDRATHEMGMLVDHFYVSARP